ncbi:MAG: peptide chain release factor-like protein [Endomicrobium sp.]|nr:peptide chain release factor-like protein [Endomicrobium sp.]
MKAAKNNGINVHLFTSQSELIRDLKKSKGTDMTDFGVSPKKQEELDKKFEKYKVQESDIEEKFIRSSEKGGQNVNKVSTTVYLKHYPTGIAVKCCRDRELRD